MSSRRRGESKGGKVATPGRCVRVGQHIHCESSCTANKHHDYHGSLPSPDKNKTRWTAMLISHGGRGEANSPSIERFLFTRFLPLPPGGPLTAEELSVHPQAAQKKFSFLPLPRASDLSGRPSRPAVNLAGARVLLTLLLPGTLPTGAAVKRLRQSRVPTFSGVWYGGSAAQRGGGGWVWS